MEEARAAAGRVAVRVVVVRVAGARVVVVKGEAVRVGVATAEAESSDPGNLYSLCRGHSQRTWTLGRRRRKCHLVRVSTSWSSSRMKRQPI